MLHPLGSSLALVWPDAIKGYGDKYGDNSFESSFFFRFWILVLLQIYSSKSFPFPCFYQLTFSGHVFLESSRQSRFSKKTIWYGSCKFVFLVRILRLSLGGLLMFN